MPRPSLTARLPLALALCAAACSAAVDPETFPIRCETQSGARDPCAEIGLTCASGTCQSCEPSIELCDGRDNDCDGTVDEGHDADGDGYTWCGGGRPEAVDCVPDDPAIRPALDDGDEQERCDGRDNDCDGEVDEHPRCAETRECIAGWCAGELVCDRARNRCVAPRTRGSLCRSDAECGEGGFCISTAALGLDGVLADSLCATACCTDRDCAAGSVCVQPGSGARVCLPREIAGRQNLESGERCLRSAECASGVCQDGRCVATCSSDADCDGTVCRLNAQASTLLVGAGAWICGEPGRLEPAALCTALDPTSCRSGLCHDSRCLAPCGADGDCAEGSVCGYVTVRGLLGAGRVTACLPAASVESGAPGATCCTSADCAGGSCRAARVGASWGMYCSSGVD